MIFAFQRLFTIQIEIGVIGEVDHGRGIGNGLVVDAEFIGGGDMVGHFDIQITRITGIAVGTEKREFQRSVINDFGIPETVGVALAAMQGIRTAVVIEFQIVFFSVQHETAIGDAVGEAADQSPEIRAFVSVIFGVLKTEQYIDRLAVTVGSTQRNERAAPIGDIHFKPGSVGQRVELGLFAAGGGKEIIDFHNNTPS